MLELNSSANKTCVLSEDNVGTSGAQKMNEAWDYYERKALTLDCSDMYKCANKKCIQNIKVIQCTHANSLKNLVSRIGVRQQKRLR
jgi:hypothetical protein